MEHKNKYILVTGSSGYVGLCLVNKLKNDFNVFGIDLIKSPTTNFNYNISDPKLIDEIEMCLPSSGFSIVNLAAAKTDFGMSPLEYYEINVAHTKSFLQNISAFNINKFIHVSSVASLDGKYIDYHNELSCDDAYRVTKYIQEQIIIKFCKKNNIELTVLYPSAIFSSNSGVTSNINKLQQISKYLPIIPSIEARKTLTNLDFFTDFIEKILKKNVPSGNYLTIERPIYSVSKMIKILSNKKIPIVKIPMLKQTLYAVSYILYIFSGFGYYDSKLTPNRVKKLYSDTVYDDHTFLNLEDYNAHSNKLDIILKDIL